ETEGLTRSKRNRFLKGAKLWMHEPHNVRSRRELDAKQPVPALPVPLPVDVNVSPGPGDDFERGRTQRRWTLSLLILLLLFLLGVAVLYHRGGAGRWWPAYRHRVHDALLHLQRLLHRRKAGMRDDELVRAYIDFHVGAFVAGQRLAVEQNL